MQCSCIMRTWICSVELLCVRITVSSIYLCCMSLLAWNCSVWQILFCWHHLTVAAILLCNRPLCFHVSVMDRMYHCQLHVAVFCRPLIIHVCIYYVRMFVSSGDEELWDFYCYNCSVVITCLLNLITHLSQLFKQQQQFIRPIQSTSNLSNNHVYQ